MFRRLLSSDLLQGFAIYFGTSVLNRALPFLLLPLLTAYLGTEQYGVLSLYQAILAIALPIIGMNMSVNVTRIFFKEPREVIAQTVSAVLAVLSCSVAALTLIAVLVATFRGGIMGIPPFWLIAIPLIVGATSVNDLGLTILRNQQRAFNYGVLEISKTALELGITLYLVIQLQQGWEGRVAGIAISSIVLGSISAHRLWKSKLISRVLTRDRVNSVLRLSLPFIPHALGTALISMSDRFFIGQLLDTSAVGIYAAGAQLGMIMSVIVTSFNRSWSPWFFKTLAINTDQARKRIVQVTYMGFGTYLLIAVILSAFASWLFLKMTAEEFHSGITVIPWITFGYAMQGMYTLVFGYAVHAARTHQLALITATVTVITLALNYWLISTNGIVGAAQTTFAAYALMFAGTWWLANSIYKMPWFTFR